jgi:hypothetical protein
MILLKIVGTIYLLFILIAFIGMFTIDNEKWQIMGITYLTPLEIENAC